MTTHNPAARLRRDVWASTRRLGRFCWLVTVWRVRTDGQVDVVFRGCSWGPVDARLLGWLEVRKARAAARAA